MSQVITIQKEDEHRLVPYKFALGYGDCADSIYARNVSKQRFANNFAFKIAGRLKVKHAP